MMKSMEINALALAYLGDAVYELWVRSHLIERGFSNVQSLHKEATNYVRASTQAKLLHRLMPELTEEETQVVLRGRNAKGGHPKNVDVVTYRYATAFESLVGHWHLEGLTDRMQWAFDQVESVIEEERGRDE